MSAADNQSDLYYHRILRAIIRQGETEADVAQSRAAAEWLGLNISPINRCSSDTQLRLIDVIWRHYRDTGEVPGRVALDGLCEREKSPGGLTSLLTMHDAMAESALGPVVPARDLDVVLDDMIADWRTAHLTQLFRDGLSALTGTTIKEDGKSLVLKGPDEAVEYVRSRMPDYMPIVRGSQVQGDWVDHSASMADNLLDMRRNPLGNKVLTGIAPLDRTLSIGPGEEIRFVGVLGASGHMKTQTLLAMIYNMARSGHHVLFVPRESSVEAAWRRLTWLHSEYCEGVRLPELGVWTRTPHLVSDEDVQALHYVMHDLQTSGSIKGSIDVIAAKSWVDIQAHLDLNRSKKYAVLAIDYLAHLEVDDSKYRNPIDGHKADFRKAQMLCQDYDGGRGIVVITPLQVNREGKKRANDKEGKDWGSYEGDQAAIDYFTTAGHDMDAIIGVFSADELKRQGMVKLSCTKSRNEFFDPFILQLDPVTRYPNEVPGDMIEIQAQTVSDEAYLRGRKGRSSSTYNPAMFADATLPY